MSARFTMPSVWPIAKFLFKLVAPSIPEIVSTVTNLKKQEAEIQTHGSTLEVRFTDIDRQFTQQLELIDKVTGQLTHLHALLQRTLLISIVAILLSLIGLAFILYTLY